MLYTHEHKLQKQHCLFKGRLSNYRGSLPAQFPDESKNVAPPQVSAVHTLGAAPRRVSEPLQVKQCAGLTGLEHVEQESWHPV